MIVKYTYEEMYAIWRNMLGLEPELGEASVERFDSIDLRRRITLEMRAWYMNYLYTAPLDRLPVSDITEYARVVAGPGQDRWTIKLSCAVTKITEVVIGSVGPLCVLNPDDAANADLLRRLDNRIWRHGCRPVALHRPGDTAIVINVDGRTAPVIERISGVMVPESDFYYVDEREIPAIKDISLT